MKKIFTLVIAAALLASCSFGKKDNLITQSGVGTLKFGMEKPELKGCKAEKMSQYYEMDDYTEEYWEFKDGKGQIAAVYHPDYRIDVFSPDYRTDEGLKPGDTLAKATEIYGDFSIYQPDEMGFVFEFVPEKMAFELKLDAMKGGAEAFDAWWQSPDPRNLTLDDFEPGAEIVRIMVRND